MNKLFNWTFGSFFRTLGRFLFYLLIGFLITQLINISDIKLPSIFNVLEVDAMENINLYQGYNISDSGMFWNVGSSGASQRGYRVYTTDSDNYAYYADPTSNITLSNGGGGMGITQCGYGFLANNYYSITYIFNSGYSPYLHPYYTNKNPQVVGFSNSNASYYSNVNYTSVNNNVQQVHTGDGDYISLFTIIAKANSTGTCVTITFSANSSLSYNDYFYFRGAKIESLGSQAPSTTEISNALTNQFNQLNTTINNLSSAINQQSQQQHQDSLNTQDKIDDINDTLNDDSIDNSSISDFVDSMDNEPSSLTPFSDFINLPLTWVQSLLASNQNCQTIQLPLPFLQNKTLDLPCMTDFWNRMGSLKTLIELVWIAIVGVRIFNGLFLLTCDVIDPNPDQDMTKLRTWEL